MQPAKPTAPSHDDLSRLIGDITVNCTNNAATHAPKSKGYALIADSYTTGNVEGSAENGYTYTVTVNAEKYVSQFDIDTGATHTPRDGSQAVTLKYENDAWTVKEGKPVSFDVACVALPTFSGLQELLNQEIFVECNTKSAHTKTPYDLIADSYTIEGFSTMTDHLHRRSQFQKICRVVQWYYQRGSHPRERSQAHCADLQRWRLGCGKGRPASRRL